MQGCFLSQNQGPRATYIAILERLIDQRWYIDSEATHHLTNTA